MALSGDRCQLGMSLRDYSVIRDFYLIVVCIVGEGRVKEKEVKGK